MKNPFIGPHPLPMNDPIFGRDREITELRHLLIAERIVLLYSPSGAGKSSLVNAGLIPEFANSFDVWEPTRVNTPSQNSTTNPYVQSAIAGWKKPGEQTNLKDFVTANTTSKNPLLIFDQFEEILRTNPTDTEGQKEFFRQLADLLALPHIWVLIIIREDFLAPLLPHFATLPTHLRHRYRLNLFTPKQAEASMRGLAAQGDPKRIFQPDALAELTANLSTAIIQSLSGKKEVITGSNVEPMQLQVVCHRLWNGMAAHDTIIDLGDVKKHADVVASLGAYYNDAITEITGKHQTPERAIRDWFSRKLITREETRGQVEKGELTTKDLPTAIVEDFVAKYIVRAEERRTTRWYELAHDSLVRPILKANAEWRATNLTHAQKAADTWAQNGKPDGLLLTGDDLTAAQSWSGVYTAVEKDFLERSARRQAIEDAQKAAAIREAEQNKKLRKSLRIVIAVSVVAFLLAGAAWVSFKQAKAAVVEARVQLSRVTLSKVRESQSNNESSTALAFAARAYSLNPSSLAARLALTALIRSTNFSHHLWSADTFPKGEPFTIYHRGRENPQFVAFSRDGSRLATLQKDAVFVWDTREGVEVTPPKGFPIGTSEEQPRPALSPDGTLLLAGTGPHSARLWDIAKDSPVGPEINATGQRILAMSFSAGGRPITVTESTLQLWNPESPTKPFRHHSTPSYAEFSADGRRLLTRAGSNWQLWDLESPDPLSRPLLELPAGQYTGMFLSPNGQHLLSWTGTKLTFRNLAAPTHPPVSVVVDGPIQSARINLSRSLLVVRTATFISLHSASTGTPIGSPIGLDDVDGWLTPDGLYHLSISFKGSLRFFRVSPAPPSSGLSAPFGSAGSVRIVWHPSGTQFATTAEKSVQLWDAAHLHPIGQPFVHPEPVNAAILSADGKSLLSISAHATIHHWILATREVRPLKIPDQRLHSLAERDPGHFSVLAVDEANRSVVTIYDVPSREILKRNHPLLEKFISGELLSGGTKAHVRSGEELLYDLVAHKTTYVGPGEVSFSPDAQRFYASPNSGMGQLYGGNREARIGNPIPGGDAYFASKVPLFLIAKRNTGTYQLYDSNTGEPVLNPRALPAGTLTLSFTPGGDSLLVATKTALYLEPLLLGSGSHSEQELLVELAELMSATTINQFGGPVAIPDHDLKSRLQQLRELLEDQKDAIPAPLRRLAESLFPELEK